VLFVIPDAAYQGDPLAGSGSFWDLRGFERQNDKYPLAASIAKMTH